MKMLRSFLALGCLFAGSTAQATNSAAFGMIDGKLREGDWEAARAASLQQIELSRGTLVAPYLAGAVARLALAEAGLEREEDALWHWHIAQNLDRGLILIKPLSTFGKAGELLARHSLRRLDEPPAGWMVLRTKDPEVRPGPKLEGELPKLSATVGLVQAPKSLKVQVVIDREGRLREPVVISGGVPGMIWEVLEGLRGWRYEPARRGEQAVAVFRELLLNPPAEKPLPKVATLSGRAAEVENLLRAHQWQEADKQARKLWNEELNQKAPDRERLAAALALRALAEAGAGETDAAVCRWQAAQHLDHRLFDADLSPYGVAGEILEENRWGVAQTKNLGGTLRVPEVKKRAPLQYPKEVRSLELKGVVTVSGIVDERGAFRQPVLVSLSASNLLQMETIEPLGSLISPSGERNLARLMAISALDSSCGWRFQPATAGGTAVPYPVAYQEVLSLPLSRSSSPHGVIIGWDVPIEPRGTERLGGQPAPNRSPPP